MPRVVHFDVSADDPERAVRFYRDVFGWEIRKWDGPLDYWMIKTGESGKPGIDGGLGKRDDPSAEITVIIDVVSVDDYAKKIVTAGGIIEKPKQTIPGVGYLAICRDTEDNTFGIMQSDMSAK